MPADKPGDAVHHHDLAVVQLIASRCTELESGGRMIDAILTNAMLPAISTEFLNRLLQGTPATHVRVSVEGGEFAYAFSSVQRLAISCTTSSLQVNGMLWLSAMRFWMRPSCRPMMLPSMASLSG